MTLERSTLIVLAALFAASGCAALIDQIVWLRLLWTLGMR